MKYIALIKGILFLLIFSLSFTLSALSEEEAVMEEEPEYSGPFMTGLKVLTPQEKAELDKKILRLTGIAMNDIAYSRLNEARAGKRLQLLNRSLVVPRGMEVRGAIGETGAQAAMSRALTREDYLFLDSLPSSVDNSELKYFPPIGNQGYLGSCVGFATTYYAMTHMYAMVRDINVKAAGKARWFSPKWPYNLLNGVDHHVGIAPNAAYEIGVKHGCATWKELPYNKDFTSWCLKPDVWRDAISRRFLEYGRITDVNTQEGILKMKQMLVNGYVLNFGTFVFSWKYMYTSNDPSTQADDSFYDELIAVGLKEDHLGPHEMTIVGYNDDVWVDLDKDNVVDPNEKGAFRVANSWGKNINVEGMYTIIGRRANKWDKGFAWISYDSILKSYYWYLFYNEVTFIVPRPAYSPRMVCEFTVRHQKRNQLELRLGTSALDQVLPTQAWYPMAFFSGLGGSQPFYGANSPPDRQDPYDGKFFLDFTDLLPEDGSSKRYHLTIADQNKDGYAATLKSFKLIDYNGKVVNFTGSLPVSVDGAVLYPSIIYQLAPMQSRLLGAFMTAIPLSGLAPLVVNLAADTSNPDAIAYYWDFGDGTKGFGQSITHAYMKAGSFRAKLTVLDNKGVSSSFSRVITVQ